MQGGRRGGGQEGRSFAKEDGMSGEDLGRLEEEEEEARPLGSHLIPQHPPCLLLTSPRGMRNVASTPRLSTHARALTPLHPTPASPIRPPPPAPRSLPLQVVSAVAFLHEKCIVHRDIKPDNLVFESRAPDSPIKLIDFGYAGHCSSDKPLRGLCGTPDYAAPEILTWYTTDKSKKAQGTPYGAPVDMWSLGVVLYILLCGFPPFYGDDDEQMFGLIRAGSYSFPEASACSTNTSTSAHIHRSTHPPQHTSTAAHIHLSTHPPQPSWQ